MDINQFSTHCRRSCVSCFKSQSLHKMLKFRQIQNDFFKPTFFQKRTKTSSEVEFLGSLRNVGLKKSF